MQFVLSRWRDSLIQANLKQRDVPLEAMRPFEVKTDDIAAPGRASAAIWSKLLPFVLLIWSLTGAFYPAIDLCAGEKDAGRWRRSCAVLRSVAKSFGASY